MTMKDGELSAPTRSLLDAARDGLGPNAAAIARMRGKIGIAVAGGAAAGAGAGASGLLSNKLLLAVVLAAAAGGAMIATRPSAPTTDRSFEAPSQPALEAPAPTLATARESIPVAVEQPVIEMPTLVRKSIKVKPAARTVDLKREVELVDRAMASLRAGDTTGALAAVRLHAAETGGAGQLAEDVAAIELEALCKRKDPVATQKLAVFDQRWPGSAQRAKLCR